MPEETNIEEFIVQEMIKTFKSVSNRLQKDFLILALMLLYIFIAKTIPIPWSIKGLNYNEPLNKIVVLIVFFILYMSISSHIFKVYILYRKIDGTIKNDYYGSVSSIQDKLQGATLMTSFIISDNFISDLIVSGHKRHPSIRRIVFLNILFTMFSIIIFFIIYHDLIRNVITWHYLLTLTFIIYISIFLIFTHFFFVKRSAFLKRAEIGRNILTLIYERLLTYSESNIDKIRTGLTQLDAEFKAIKPLSIFDSDDYIRIIEKNFPLLEKYFTEISQEEIDKSNDSHIMANNIREICVHIKNISENLARFQEATDYALAIDYHSNKVFSKPANNIFSFICHALKN